MKKALLAAKAETKASTLHELGESYLSIKQRDSAAQYFNRALAFATRYNDSPTAIKAFSALGFIAEANKDYTNAIDYYRRAYDISDSVRIAKKAKDNTPEVYSNNFMMDVMGSIKQSAQTTEQILKTIADKKALNDTLALSINYFNLGLLYKSRQMYDKALNAFKTSLDYAGQINYAEMQLSAVNQIADLYEFNGEYSEALTYLKKRAEINTLLNSPKAKTAVELQASMDKREAELLHQKLEITQRTYWIVGISLLVVLLLVIGLIYYRQTQLRQRNIAMQAIIATEESERQRIARDLHDSVSQTMSAAKINLSIIGSEMTFKDEEQRLRFYKVVGMVDDGFKEVRTISHNMMPWALHKTGLSKVISQFIGNIENGTISFNFFSRGFDEPFNDQLELILYRVLQESVNNVIKHAGANRVDIALIKDESSISLTIEDNGKGFDASHPDFKAGMGLGNLRSRINYLKGKVEVDSQPGRGALVSVYIPLNAL
ncbi:tetratricopeptide repeat-containing sensor histidine kinase [Mucilaginibacter auburnensis]|uniref:tetratricopeptide repeat-containing sensor histidine kinase n=1 Tax=Mucilaginibacter auburnensis TaxID=1457233 RepID=UPI00147651B5|nr:sensor histidine kinase [Mucilaginibacter auburnensis]